MFGRAARHKYASTKESESDNPEPTAAGIPASKSLLSWRDILTIFVVLGVALRSIIAVYLPAAAVSLGQTNQLVVVGFCLIIMSIGTARQVTLVSIIFGVQKGTSSLQDFEALLRKDLWATHAGLRAKLTVSLLTAISLALSGSYKRFVGGSSSVQVTAPEGDFGLAMPPAFGRVGIGLALAVDQYLPYWLDADVNRTYGFALYVVSNTTAALLDTPFASYFTNLQKDVRGEDSVLVSATVNATVTESKPFTPEQLTAKEEDMADVHCILWASHTPHSNARTIVSAWNNRNDTMQHQARQLFTNRREAHGTWRITSSNITLDSAQLLPETDQTRAWVRQRIIAEQELSVDNTLLREFDYMRFPRPRNVDTTPALVAVTQGTLINKINRYKLPGEFSFWENTYVSDKLWGSVNHYHKSSSEILITRQRVSLRRSPMLLFILLLNPALTLLGVLVKLRLYRCPVDENVGLVSLLAAVEPETLGLVRGAALSGRLSKRVNTRFVVEGERIEVWLGMEDGGHRVERGVVYG